MMRRSWHAPWLSSLEVGLHRIVYAEAVHHPPLLRAFREVTAPFDELLSAYFARLAVERVIDVDDPLALARQYMHLAAGETLERAILDDQPSEEDARRDVRRAVAIMTASFREGRRRRG